MNDFTKEELESILDWAYSYTEFGNSWVYLEIKPLMDKIQSMIKNYCEHESCDIDYSHQSLRCKKCKVIVE